MLVTRRFSVVIGSYLLLSLFALGQTFEVTLPNGSSYLVKNLTAGASVSYKNIWGIQHYMGSYSSIVLVKGSTQLTVPFTDIQEIRWNDASVAVTLTDGTKEDFEKLLVGARLNQPEVFKGTVTVLGRDSAFEAGRLVSLKRPPASPAHQIPTAVATNNETSAALVIPLTEQLRVEMGLYPGTKGVVLKQPYYGLPEGCVIASIGHQSIRTAEDFTARWQIQQKNGQFPVDVWRKDRKGTWEMHMEFVAVPEYYQPQSVRRDYQQALSGLPPRQIDAIHSAKEAEVRYAKKLILIAEKADRENPDQVAADLAAAKKETELFQNDPDAVQARKALLETITKDASLAQKILLRTTEKTVADRQDLLVNLATSTLTGGGTVAPLILEHVVDASFEVLGEEGVLSSDKARLLQGASGLLKALNGAAPGEVVPTLTALRDAYKGIIELGISPTDKDNNQVRVSLKSGIEALDFVVTLQDKIDESRTAPSSMDKLLAETSIKKLFPPPPAEELPMAIQTHPVLSLSGGSSDWRYPRYDLAGTAHFPTGSKVRTGNSLHVDTVIPDIETALTGDVDGDGDVEIVTTSGNTIRLFSSDGRLKKTITLPVHAFLAFLEDADRDGVLDLFLGSSGSGFTAFIYKGNGSLIKSFPGKHAGGRDVSMRPLTLTHGKMLVGYNAGFARTPRGIAAFDFASGNELWYYQIGPANGHYSVGDIDKDGLLDIALSSFTVHNGGTGNDSSDGDLYLIVVDENGKRKISQPYSLPRDGYVLHVLADLNGDGKDDIIGLKGHDATYYKGPARIHSFSPDGALLHTFDGRADNNWIGKTGNGSYAIGDLTGDGKPEIVCSSTPTLETYVLDSDLNRLSAKSMNGEIKLITDINGDGIKELILFSEKGLLTVADRNLNVLSSLQVGSVGGDMMACLLNDDDKIHLICRSDKLYIVSPEK